MGGQGIGENKVVRMGRCCEKVNRCGNDELCPQTLCVPFAKANHEYVAVGLRLIPVAIQLKCSGALWLMN